MKHSLQKILSLTASAVLLLSMLSCGLVSTAVAETDVLTVAEDFEEATNDTYAGGTVISCTTPFGKAMTFAKDDTVYANGSNKISGYDVIQMGGSATAEAIAFYYDATAATSNVTMRFTPINANNWGECIAQKSPVVTIIDGVLNESNTTLISSNFTMTFPAGTAGWVILDVSKASHWDMIGGGPNTSADVTAFGVCVTSANSIVLDQFAYVEDVATFSAAAAESNDGLPGYTGIGHSYVNGVCSVCGDSIFTQAQGFESATNDSYVNGITDICATDFGKAVVFSYNADLGSGTASANFQHIAFDTVGTAEDEAMVFYYDNTTSGKNAVLYFAPVNAAGAGTTIKTGHPVTTIIDGVLTVDNTSIITSNFTMTLPANSSGWVMLQIGRNGTGAWALWGGAAVTSGVTGISSFAVRTNSTTSVALDQFGFVKSMDAFAAYATNNANVAGYTGKHNWSEATCAIPKTCKDCGVTEGEPTDIHTWKNGTCSVCGKTVMSVGQDFESATDDSYVNGVTDICATDFGKSVVFSYNANLGSGTASANFQHIAFDTVGTAEDEAMVFYYDNTTSGKNAVLYFAPVNAAGAGTTIKTGHPVTTIIDGVLTVDNTSIITSNFTMTLPANSSGWVMLQIGRNGTGAWALWGGASVNSGVTGISSFAVRTNNTTSVALDQFGFVKSMDEFATFAVNNANVNGYTGKHNWSEATCAAPKTCKDCGITEGEPTGVHAFVGGTCSVCGEVVYTVAEDFNDSSVTGTEGSWSTMTSPFGQALKFGREESKTEIKINFDKVGAADHTAVVFYYDNTVSGNSGAAYFNFIPRYNGGCGLTLGTTYTYYAVIDGEIQTLNPNSNFCLKLPAKTAGWVILPLPASGTWSYGGGSGYTGKVENIAGVDLAFPEYHNASVLVDQFGFTKDIELFETMAIAGNENLNGYKTIGSNLIGYLGTSVNEAENALRFGFTLEASGITVDGYQRDISAATVVINGETYELKDFGAIVSNNPNATLTLEGVDGKRTKNIVGEKLFDLEDNTAYFACGIKNIPAANKNSMIYACPYFIYSNGTDEIVVYGDEYEQSINGCLAL